MALSRFLPVFGTSFLGGLSGALTPGPLFAVAVTESARRGFWAGPVLVAAHSLLGLGAFFSISALASLARRPHRG